MNKHKTQYRSNSERSQIFYSYVTYVHREILDILSLKNDTKLFTFHSPVQKKAKCSNLL